MNHEEVQELINDVENALHPFLVKNENNFEYSVNCRKIHVIYGNIMLPNREYKEQIRILLTPLRIYFNLFDLYSIDPNTFEYKLEVWYHPKREIEKKINFLKNLIERQIHGPFDNEVVEQLIENLNNHREDLPKNYYISK